jgi:hypothetical protein
MFSDLTYIVHYKTQLFVTGKSDQDRIRIRIGFAPWIQICFEVKSWIRIRIKNNAYPKL